jgi:hypothetical protein
VAVAAYFALRHRPAPDRPTGPPTASPVVGIASDDEPVTAPVAPTAAAAAKIEEISSSSETFRNTTFVIAIRSAGYVCDDVADVYRGDTGSGTWRVSCRDMRAYTVGVADDGAFAIEPVLHYFDAPVPFPNPDTPRELRELLR